MFAQPSLVARIAVGKAAGLVVGLVAFLSFPRLVPGVDPLVPWGFMLWYLTLGAFVGLASAVDREPAFGLPFPWWLRAPLIGAWMNLVLTLIAADLLRAYAEALFGAGALFTSPFWFVAEGAVVGLAIGWAATRAGGEGPATAGR